MEFVIHPQEWWKKHLEGFVKPHLGKEPTIEDFMKYYIKINCSYSGAHIPTDHHKLYPFVSWTYPSVLVLVACWNEVLKKAKGRKILLAGRDTYQFNMLAEMAGMKPIDKTGHDPDAQVVFRPDLSGAVSSVKSAVKHDYKDYYLADTGYAGSVPRKLGVPNYGLMFFSSPSNGNGSKEDHQIFPKNNTVPYRVAGAMEGAAKYWRHAACDADGKVTQGFEAKESFQSAALLSLHIVNHLTRMLDNPIKSSLATMVMVGKQLHVEKSSFTEKIGTEGTYTVTNAVFGSGTSKQFESVLRRLRKRGRILLRALVTRSKTRSSL